MDPRADYLSDNVISSYTTHDTSTSRTSVDRLYDLYTSEYDFLIQKMHSVSALGIAILAI